MNHGFYGRLLEVDLSTGATAVRTFGPEVVRRYFLGSGLAARMLYHDYEPELDPYDPRSPLLFFSGLFTGALLPATSKVTVCARSPATGIWNESAAGGHWPAELRRTGYDGIVLLGQSEKPVTLRITPDAVELSPADDLWGLDTYAVEERLRPRIGPKAKIATIGQAGERRQAIAGVIFDPPISRAAGRGGMGAVMGAKRLKAIVVEGDSRTRVSIADLDGLRALIKSNGKDLRRRTLGLREFGTSGGVPTVEKNGELPIRNWQGGSWKEGARAISGQVMQPDYLDKHYSCFACPIRCGKIYRHEDRELHGHGPEFETLGMLGSNCLVDDPEDVIEGNELCNRYGLDTISTGSAIAFAMEAFERGLISEADTGGPIGWDGKSMLRLVHLIGRAEGFGAVLGQGVRSAAEVIGGYAAELAVHTKGLEYPAHDPRGHVSMGLSYATANRGACHMEGLTFFLDRGVQLPDFGYLEPPDPHDSSDKPPIVVNLQNYMSVFNPLGMCKFLFVGGIGPSMIATWIRGYAGWDMDMDEVLEVGERLFNMKRMYNVRLGISRKDDVAPPRLYAEARPDGVSAGVLPDLGKMLHEYYQLRGWSTLGIPTETTLERLGISAPAAC